MPPNTAQQTEKRTSTKAPKAKTTTAAVPPESDVVVSSAVTETASAAPQSEVSVTAVEAVAAVEGETDTDTVESEAPPPRAASDPFDYDKAIITLSFSFLPVTDADSGTPRTVIVSAHSKSGDGKSVLPEFIAPLSEADLALPATVTALLERYRTVVLPQRQAAAAARAAALAAKRPVASSRSKDARPEHIVAKASKRGQSSELGSAQLKLNFSSKAR